jgi:hypothetical protein
MRRKRRADSTMRFVAVKTAGQQARHAVFGHGSPGPPAQAADQCAARSTIRIWRHIRRLLITGAMVIVRWACRKAAQEGTWLHRMLRRKPRMLVAIALADKMARGKIIEVLRLLPSDPRSVARSRERRACEEVEER